MLNVRAWFKEESKSVLLYQAMHEIFKGHLNKPNYLSVEVIHSKPRVPDYESEYGKRGFVSRVLAVTMVGKTAPMQYYATFLLAAEALGGFVEASIDGMDFRNLMVTDPSRNETIFFEAREILDKLGIKVMAY